MSDQYINFVKQWSSLIAKSTSGFRIEVLADHPPFMENVKTRLRYEEMSVCHTTTGWLMESPEGDVPVSIVASEDYSKMTAYIPHSDDAPKQEEKFKFLIKTALECAFPFHDTVSLHSACVEINGVAVAFTGPSGLGKSTRAYAWVEQLGANLISGDRPAVRLEDGAVMACGVPWDGKEQHFTTVERPLRAILEVRRAPFCAMRKLNVEQARKLLMQQCLIPMWDNNAAAAAISVIRRLIDVVPVYRLFCGPDGNSAEWAHRILFGGNQDIIQEERQDMKIKDGFVLRNIMGEHIVMPIGENAIKFEGALVINDVSAYLWEKLSAPISREDLLALLLAEFDVEPAVAEPDLDAFLDDMRRYELLRDNA